METVNWDAVGAVAEAMGALGVILTLLYLVRQINQNTAATRSTAAAAYSEASLAIATILSRDVETNSRFYRYLENPEQLTLEEQRHAQAIVSSYLHAMEQACDLYTEGALTEEKWQSRFKQIVWIAVTPGFALYWQQYSGVYAETFVGYVEEARRVSGAG